MDAVTHIDLVVFAAEKNPFLVLARPSFAIYVGRVRQAVHSGTHSVYGHVAIVSAFAFVMDDVALWNGGHVDRISALRATRQIDVF